MNERTDSIQGHIDRAAKACGGVAKLADLVGASSTAPTMWKSRNSVPPQYCALIEQACGQIVMRWDLRPDDWSRIWPELIGAPGAPAVSTPAIEAEKAVVHG